MRASRTQYYSDFDPNRLGTCLFWIDADDPDTVTQSGGTVSSVRDKSRNGYIFSNGTGFTYPNNTFNGTYPSFYSSTVTTNRLLGSNTSVEMPRPLLICWVGQGISAGATSTSSNTLLYGTTAGTGNSINRIGSNGNWIVQSRQTSTPYTTLGVFSVHITSNVLYGSNGSTVGSLGAASATTTGIVLGAQSTLSNSYAGHLCEMIVMAGTAFSNRTAIEGYLAWKWGLQTLLRTSHTFRYSPPVMRPFYPLDLNGCSYWFDAADRTTITTSGNSVTEWVNKTIVSGVAAVSNSNLIVYAGAPTSGLLTQNGSNLVSTGTNGALRFRNSGFPIVDRVRAFAIRPTTNTTSSTILFLDQSGTLTGRDRISFESSGRLTETSQGNVVILQTGVLPNQSNVFGIYTFGLCNTNTVWNRVGYNGSNVALTTSASGGGFTTGNATVAYIGSNLDIGDWISYSATLYPEEIQQIEGFLAWKWGVQSSLPSSHPFRFCLPLTPTFSPAVIGSNANVGTLANICTLWLDAADSNVFTGADPWVDKSGNGNNGINGTPGTSSMPTRVDWGNGNFAARFVAGSLNSIKTTSTTMQATINNIFIVCKLAQAISGGSIFYNSTNTRRLYTNSSSFPATLLAYTNNASVVTLTTVNQNEGFIWNVAIPGSGASSNYVNGTYSGGGTVTTGASTFYFGSGPNTAYASVDIGEILVYPQNLLPSERLRIEGYLAWKWGLQTKLPTNHPYRSVKP